MHETSKKLPNTAVGIRRSYKAKFFVTVYPWGSFKQMRNKTYFFFLNEQRTPSYTDIRMFTSRYIEEFYT